MNKYLKNYKFQKYSEMEETMCNMFNDENRSQEKQTELKKDILEFKDPEETKSVCQIQTLYYLFK